jgi:Tol biopolymer transport system component
VKLIPVGPGEPRVLQTDSLIVGRARFLTDGKNILVRGNRRGESALWWVLPIGGGKPVPVEQSEDAARYIANSPDGKWVAFAKKGGKIRIQPLAGGRAREIAFADSTQIRSPVQWSADGRFLYALDPRSGTSMRIYKVDVRTGAESLWKTIEPPDPTGVFLIPEVVVARNGAAYAYSFCQMLGDLYMATGLK